MMLPAPAQSGQEKHRILIVAPNDSPVDEAADRIYIESQNHDER